MKHLSKNSKPPSAVHSRLRNVGARPRMMNKLTCLRIRRILNTRRLMVVLLLLFILSNIPYVIIIVRLHYQEALYFSENKRMITPMMTWIWRSYPYFETYYVIATSLGLACLSIIPVLILRHVRVYKMMWFLAIGGLCLFNGMLSLWYIKRVSYPMLEGMMGYGVWYFHNVDIRSIRGDLEVYKDRIGNYPITSSDFQNAVSWQHKRTLEDVFMGPMRASYQYMSDGMHWIFISRGPDQEFEAPYSLETGESWNMLSRRVRRNEYRPYHNLFERGDVSESSDEPIYPNQDYGWRGHK